MMTLIFLDIFLIEEWNGTGVGEAGAGEEKR